jgi:hypothetical protein
MSPIVSPRRPREHSHRPVLSLLGGHGKPRKPQTDCPDVTEARRPADVTEARRPALRIVTEESHEVTSVLLAGADACRREALRAELSATLPPRTPFSEAEEVSEVLERAPSSGVVILTGDLDDADADSLVRLLGRRHPRLPVISFDAPLPAAAAGRG